MKALTARVLTSSAAAILVALPSQGVAQTAPLANGSGDGAVGPQSQTGGAATPSPADPEALTTDIVVTANKRSESLLRVPAAITALTGDNLRTQGINNVQDLQNVVPSVSINAGRDGATVAIRGVQTTDTSSKGEQDVAFNIDGVYVGRGNARGAAFFDIDRVEVLRGPQGTLYGRSSTGGAINIITVVPRLGEFSGYVRAEYGNFNAKRAEGAINVPLGEMFAVRLSGAVSDRDGYSRPIANTTVFNGTTYTLPASAGYTRNTQKDATGRASLFGETGGVSVRLTATLGHQGGAGNAPALETQLQASNDRGTDALRILANPVRPFLDSNFANYDAHVNAKLGGNLQVDLIGSYQWLHFRQRGSAVTDTSANDGLYAITPTFQFGNSFGPAYNFYLQDNVAKTRQAEARFSNIRSDAIDFVAGANYFRESVGESGQSWNLRVDTPTAPASQYVFQSGPVNSTVHKGYGAFGQATWNVTDRIGFVGGLRFTRNEISRLGRFSLPYDFASGFPPPPNADVAGNAICTYPNACLGGINNGGSKDSKVTFRVGVNFQVTPTALFYASIASGFKGGTFNDYDPATGGSGAVGPSSVIAYEAGYKGRPLPGLTLSSSLFYYDFSRYQITTAALFPTGGGQSTTVIFTAATPVKIYGWENEFTYQIAPQTAFSGSINYLHSSITNYQGGTYAGLGYPIDYSGQSLDQNPSFTANAALNHAFDVGDGKLRLRGGFKFSSSYLVSDLGYGVRYRQPSFTRSDASITYELGAGKYSIQLYVENVENKVQRTSLGGYFGAYGGNGGTVGAPVAGVPFRIGNGTVPANYTVNYLNFYTSTPRFYGVRLTARF